MELKSINSVCFRGKRVLLRADFNVPKVGGVVTDDTRLLSVIPTIRKILSDGGYPVILSHYGDPKGKPDKSLSLEFLRSPLEESLASPVAFVADYMGEEAVSRINKIGKNQTVLCENTRFHQGEKENRREFAEKLSFLGDVFVNDAFSVSHRAHASVVGIPEFLPAYSGMHMSYEINMLESLLSKPARPLGVIVGGAKISTKLELLKNLVGFSDYLMIGGAMANTFLAAQGHKIGASLFEADMLDEALDVLKAAKKNNCDILLPTDVMVAPSLSQTGNVCHRECSDLQSAECIFDIGLQTIEAFNQCLSKLKTIVWNGPVGVVEVQPFHKGSFELARNIAKLTHEKLIVSIAGGGDTLAMLRASKTLEEMTFASTAGGAFLAWLEGKTLLGLVPLIQKES